MRQPPSTCYITSYRERNSRYLVSLSDRPLLCTLTKGIPPAYAERAPCRAIISRDRGAATWNTIDVNETGLHRDPILRSLRIVSYYQDTVGRKNDVSQRERVFHIFHRCLSQCSERCYRRHGRHTWAYPPMRSTSRMLRSHRPVSCYLRCHSRNRSCSPLRALDPDFTISVDGELLSDTLLT